MSVKPVINTISCVVHCTSQMSLGTEMGTTDWCNLSNDVQMLNSFEYAWFCVKF